MKPIKVFELFCQMEKNFKLKPPMMPNFISVETGVKLKQEGFASALTIPVDGLSKEEAEEYGELIKQTFIVHWQNRVTAKGSRSPFFSEPKK